MDKIKIYMFCKFFIFMAWVIFSHSVYAIDPQALCEGDARKYLNIVWGNNNFEIVPTFITNAEYPNICYSCWAFTRDSQGVPRGGGNATACAVLKKSDTKPTCDKTGVAGNPIRLNDGAKYEYVEDIVAPENSDLSWSRYYISTAGEWSFLQPTSLVVSANGVTNSSGYYLSSPVLSYKWEASSFTLPDGSEGFWHHNLSGGEILLFDTKKYFFIGRQNQSLQFGEIKNNNIYTYTVSGSLINASTFKAKTVTPTFDQNTGRLIKLNDSLGKQLDFFYSGTNLSFVESSWGAVVQYIYDSQNRLIKVGYGTNRLLAPSGFTYTQYLYEDVPHPRALTGIVDAKGIRYATWTYDTQGRAIESFHGDRKDYVLVDYAGSPSRTAVINSFGKKTIYDYVGVSGIGAQVAHIGGQPSANCALDNIYQSYFADGELQTQTDKNGIVTLYERDSKGRITKQTRGLRWPTSQPRSGVGVVTTDLVPPANASELEVIQTCWHPQFPLPSRIIEEKTVTLFDYSATGNLTQKSVKTRPQGTITCDTLIQ